MPGVFKSGLLRCRSMHANEGSAYLSTGFAVDIYWLSSRIGFVRCQYVRISLVLIDGETQNHPANPGGA